MAPVLTAPAAAPRSSRPRLLAIVSVVAAAVAVLFLFFR
jgi:hypothetical protein